jgi:hypothetical protein
MEADIMHTKVRMPLDSDCPGVIAFKAALFGDPVTGTCRPPTADDVADFALRHRSQCQRCRTYGLIYAEVTEVTDAAA